MKSLKQFWKTALLSAGSGAVLAAFLSGPCNTVVDRGFDLVLPDGRHARLPKHCPPENTYLVGRLAYLMAETGAFRATVYLYSSDRRSLCRVAAWWSRGTIDLTEQNLVLSVEEHEAALSRYRYTITRSGRRIFTETTDEETARLIRDRMEAQNVHRMALVMLDNGYGNGYLTLSWPDTPGQRRDEAFVRSARITRAIEEAAADVERVIRQDGPSSASEYHLALQRYRDILSRKDSSSVTSD